MDDHIHFGRAVGRSRCVRELFFLLPSPSSCVFSFYLVADVYSLGRRAHKREELIGLAYSAIPTRFLHRVTPGHAISSYRSTKTTSRTCCCHERSMTHPRRRKIHSFLLLDSTSVGKCQLFVVATTDSRSTRTCRTLCFFKKPRLRLISYGWPLRSPSGHYSCLATLIITCKTLSWPITTCSTPFTIDLSPKHFAQTHTRTKKTWTFSKRRIIRINGDIDWIERIKKIDFDMKACHTYIPLLRR